MFLTQPPHTDIGVGRQKLLDIYLEQTSKKLICNQVQKQGDSVYITNFRYLSLLEYIDARSVYCGSKHTQPCTECTAMFSIANTVVNDGYAKLSSSFKSAFPSLTYKADIARQKVLQMPLVCIRFGTPKDGTSAWFLFEYIEGVNYNKFACFAEALVQRVHSQPTIDKTEVKAILKLAQSDRERELIRYSIFKASGLSSTATRRTFGFEKMSDRSKLVESALEEARCVREAVEDLARVQDEALLRSVGISVPDTTSDSESDSDSMCDDPLGFPGSPSTASVEVCEESVPLSGDELSKDSTVGTQNDDIAATAEVTALEKLPLVDIGMHSDWNFFNIVTMIESEVCIKQKEKVFDSLYAKLESEITTDREKNMLQESYRAFLAVDNKEDARIVQMINGDIVTDSESDDPDAFLEHSVISERVKKLIAKRQKSIKRQKQRCVAKLLVKRRFLSRKISKKLHGVLKECPTIGKEIEAFVSERNVGADAWRRTGVLTFDGNRKVKEKVTYERIRKHLEEVYGRKFSYGTVVQLCIARNKRRHSAKNYKGVAKVTTRRARKGFTLKFNPDSHWSAALYKSLNWLQFTDGSDII